MIAPIAAVAAFAAGCGSTAAAPPRQQAPIANAAGTAAAAPSPCELDRLPRADRLVVTEHSNGHDGTLELRVELAVRAGALSGTATARYQR